MKNLAFVISVTGLLSTSANASIWCTPVAGGPPCIDRAAAARKAEIQRQFDIEQRRKQELIRQQQIQQLQQRQADQARRQREINAYYQQQQQQRQMQQQQQQAQARQQQEQLNAEARNPNAIRVQTFADSGNRAKYIAYNNTGVSLRVYISYSLRGADGSYQNGTETAVVPARGSHEWTYWMGPVPTTTRWNLQTTNIRWER